MWPEVTVTLHCRQYACIPQRMQWLRPEPQVVRCCREYIMYCTYRPGERLEAELVGVGADPRQRDAGALLEDLADLTSQCQAAWPGRGSRTQGDIQAGNGNNGVRRLIGEAAPSFTSTKLSR